MLWPYGDHVAQRGEAMANQSIVANVLYVSDDDNMTRVIFVLMTWLNSVPYATAL